MSKVILQPVGKIDTVFISRLIPCIAERFIMNISGNNPLTEPSYSFNPLRKQFFAKAILKELKNIYPEENHIVIGITDLNIYDNSSDTIISENYENITLISTFNLKTENNQFSFTRVLKEICRQIGYLSGLGNCFIKDCLMYHNPQNPDQLNSLLCYKCEHILGISQEKNS